MREIDIIKEDIGAVMILMCIQMIPSTSHMNCGLMWTNISEHILMKHLVGSISTHSFIRMEESQQCTK